MKWEYTVLAYDRGSDYGDIEDTLNGLGVEGWELVDVRDRRLILKRPLTTKSELK